MDKDAGAQALRWFVKLRSPQVTSADRLAHRQWLGTDAAHGAAYAAVASEWANLDGMQEWANSELAQLNLRAGKRRRRNAALTGLAAAAAAVAVLSMFVLWPARHLPMVQYETVKAEQRQVVLQDGSRMHLNSASSADVVFTSNAREVRLKSGEGLFDVEHDSTRPFVVRAGRHSVIALGTRFAVQITRGEIEVTVLEGRVAVVPPDAVISGNESLMLERQPMTRHRSGAGAPGVILTSNRQARIGVAGELQELDVDAHDVTAWQEGKLIFDEVPLRQVVAEIARYVPGEIRVAYDVPDFPVTGILQIRSAETMLDLLSAVVPVTAVKQSATVTVLHKNS